MAAPPQDLKGTVGPTGSGFWARQTQKDKVSILAFAVELLLSLGLVIFGVFDNDSKFGIAERLALLTGNVVAVIVTMQFAVSRFFDDQKDEIDRVGREMQDVKRLISQTLEEMESVTGLGETYVKIFRQEEGIKNQYQSTLDAFLRRLSNCIDDKRSGALDIMDYYGALDRTARSIEADFKECQSSGVTYSGEIWALTFILDDEWDDSSIHEVKWFDTLRRLDQSGIATRRLWAFDKKMLAHLAKEPIDDDGRELVRRLSMYCSDDTSFNNTHSYAVPKWEILDEHVRLFGKGFFAAAYSAGGFDLIRGVCFDNLLSQNSLGGEIDFDDVRIQQIRMQWQRYLELARPIKDFLGERSSRSARAFMQSTWRSSAALPGQGDASDVTSTTAS